MSRFVEVNDTVKELDGKLRSLFLMYYRYNDIGYADFVLSFVQCCFPDVYDSYNYRISDYWALPVETLMNGCGDDEDRAILYCAILTDAGLDAKLLYLPESTIAAVQLDLSGSSLAYTAKKVRGPYSLYTVADTSSDLRIGELRDRYDISSDGRTLYYNGNVVYGHYGLETN
jgi:hypothetical protein